MKQRTFAELEVNLNNPCNDEIYLKLKEMDDASQMSDEEFEIFKEKDKACNEFKARMTLEPENKAAESLQRAAKAGEAYMY